MGLDSMPNKSITMLSITQQCKPRVTSLVFCYIFLHSSWKCLDGHFETSYTYAAFSILAQTSWCQGFFLTENECGFSTFPWKPGYFHLVLWLILMMQSKGVIPATIGHFGLVWACPPPLGFSLYSVSAGCQYCILCRDSSLFSKPTQLLTASARRWKCFKSQHPSPTCW